MGLPLSSFGPNYALPLPLSAFQWAGAADGEAAPAVAATAAKDAAAPADSLAHLGIWPAVGLFFLFGLCDVTGVSTSRPWAMALLALAYTVFTVLGMRRYSARSWLA